MSVCYVVGDLDRKINKEEIIADIKEGIKQGLNEEFQDVKVEKDGESRFIVSSMREEGGSCSVDFDERCFFICAYGLSSGLLGPPLANAIIEYVAVKYAGTVVYDQDQQYGPASKYNKEKKCFEKIYYDKETKEWKKEKTKEVVH